MSNVFIIARDLNGITGHAPGNLVGVADESSVPYEVAVLNWLRPLVDGIAVGTSIKIQLIEGHETQSHDPSSENASPVRDHLATEPVMATPAEASPTPHDVGIGAGSAERATASAHPATNVDNNISDLNKRLKELQSVQADLFQEVKSIQAELTKQKLRAPPQPAPIGGWGAQPQHEDNPTVQAERQTAPPHSRLSSRALLDDFVEWLPLRRQHTIRKATSTFVDINPAIAAVQEATDCWGAERGVNLLAEALLAEYDLAIGLQSIADLDAREQLLHLFKVLQSDDAAIIERLCVVARTFAMNAIDLALYDVPPARQPSTGLYERLANSVQLRLIYPQASDAFLQTHHEIVSVDRTFGGDVGLVVRVIAPGYTERGNVMRRARVVTSG